MLANFKNAIRARRLRAYEVAGALGICPSTLSEVLSEQRGTTLEFRRRAAALLGAPEDWLFETLTLGPAPALPRPGQMQTVEAGGAA